MSRLLDLLALLLLLLWDRFLANRNLVDPVYGYGCDAIL